MFCERNNQDFKGFLSLNTIESESGGIWKGKVFLFGGSRV